MNNSINGGYNMINFMQVGPIGENTYFYIDDSTKHGFLIDPGSDASKILNYIKQEGYVIEKILITHGHVDHIGAVEEIKVALGCEVIAHKNGKMYLEDPSFNLSASWGMPFVVKADTFLEEGEVVSLQNNPDFKLQIIHVPGHTMDGVAYYSDKDKVVFVGDILFDGSVGRTDFPGGNGGLLLKGIAEKLFTLPEETIVYSGHGNNTTIKKEKYTNPIFHMYE